MSEKTRTREFEERSSQLMGVAEMKLNSNAQITLKGFISKFRLSHASRREKFYETEISVIRMNGMLDTIFVIADDAIVKRLGNPNEETVVEITGNIYNYRHPDMRCKKSRIYIIARNARRCRRFPNGADNNETYLVGYIEKAPSFCLSSLNRKEICEFTVCETGRNGKMYKIPCITFGETAKEVSTWKAGEKVCLKGRLQSRNYFKKVGEDYQEIITHEVWAQQIEKI